MTIRQLTNETSGTRIDIVELGPDTYRLDFYERCTGTGWRFLFSDDGWSRDAIECEYDIDL